MGLWHDMDSLVNAADLLRGDGNVRFLFAGKGRRREAAEALSPRFGLSNITWLDFQPRHHLPDVLASCDAAFISMRAGLEMLAESARSTPLRSGAVMDVWNAYRAGRAHWSRPWALAVLASHL
jgi:hypothetical protein